MSHLLIWMPGTIGVKIRRILYKHGFTSCGKNINISKEIIYSLLKYVYLRFHIGIAYEPEPLRVRETETPVSAHIFLEMPDPGYIFQFTL